MVDDKRQYLRIHIPGLIVKYNIIDTDENTLWLPRRHQIYTMIPEGIEDLEPVFQVILDRLERIENKIDHLLQWVGRGFDHKIFQYEDPIVDISGGGISINTKTDLEVGMLLELCIMSKIGDLSPIFAIGRVCRVVKEKNNNVVGIEFEDIYEEDRQAIVRMVFHAERKLRRKKQD